MSPNMKMGAGLEPWLRKMSNQLLLKLIISAVFMFITVRLFVYHNDAVEPRRGSPGYRSGNRHVVPETALYIENEYSRKGGCRIFSGQWIQNPSGPRYTNTSCPFIEFPQNCMKNGRPDTGYMYWRWKPSECELDSFDAKKFLDVMRNKSWALIGDSIFRNHATSLLCVLFKVEEPVEIDHDDKYQSRTWHFASHNFTLSLVWSPFLVQADIFEDVDGKARADPKMHLDTLDPIWTSRYHTFDYIIISGGQWFLKNAIYLENKKVVGCHHCYVENIPEMTLEDMYHKVLRNVYNFIADSDHKPLVIYRTWTPDHFEGGLWSGGGSCNRTVPYREGEYNGSELDGMMYRIELEEYQKAISKGSHNGSRLKLLDTFHLSLLRPDGHPGPYRNFRPFDKGNTRKSALLMDCLHWCLPGPVDSWNDLLMKMVLNQ